MKRRIVDLGFASRTFPEGSHIIYVYSDDQERIATMAKFLRSGLQDNEKLLYLVHDIPPAEMRQALERLGVDVGERSEAFEVTPDHARCCPEECFSADYMLGVVGEFYAGAIAKGFSGARGAGEMAWAAQGQVAFQDLIAYESRLNDVLAEHPLTTVCQYDARLFPGNVIMDLLTVHPLMLVNGQLVENPFFTPPETFLRERRTAPDA